MEADDLIAYEFVTPNGDWSWSLGSVVSCHRNCLVDIVQWADASGGALRGRDATLYYEAVREAEECSQAAKRLGDEVRVIRAQIMQQREQAEENARLARERLLAAQHAVRAIDNSHLREMRSYRTPPTLVKETLAAVLHLLRQSPVPETWDNVQRLIRRSDFIQNVLNFDPGDEDDALNRSVTTHYLSNPAMTVENVNLASRAAGPLLQWLFAKIGATTAFVELRTFDKEIHEASEKFKQKSERIGLLQVKSAAAAKRAEELKLGAAQSKLSFRKLPSRSNNDEDQDVSTREWTKDLSASSGLTILTSSILCNFGMEQGTQHTLSRDDEDMILDAHHAARRDNNERLSFALESLAAKEKELEGLHSELLETTRQNEELLALLEEERTEARRSNLAREDAARLQLELKESMHVSQAHLQRVSELEEAHARLMSDLDLLRVTTAEEQEIAHSENHALRSKATALQGENDKLTAALDAANTNIAALKSSVEQDHLGFMDDAVRRDSAWRAERQETERSIQSLKEDVAALTAEREAREVAIAQLSEQHRQDQDAIGTRINALELELEDTQAALSSAEAQNELLTQRLSEMQSTASADVNRLESMLAESEAACASLRLDVARTSEELLHHQASAAESSRSTEVQKERLAEAHGAFQKELQELQSLHEISCITLQRERDSARGEAERIAKLQQDTDGELQALKHSMQATVHEAGSELERISGAWRSEQERTKRLEEEMHQLHSTEMTLRSQLDAATADSAQRARAVLECQEQLRVATESLESQRLREQEQAKRMQLEIDHLHAKEASLQSAVDLSRTEKSLVAREMEALSERHRLELSAIQCQLEGMQQPRETTSSTPPRQLVDASEVVEMQQRLERELQYMQSVHTSNVAQHVQLQRELRSRADGLMKEAEQVRGQLRQTEERVGDLQASLEEKGEALRVAHIKLAASEAQNAQMLEALQSSAVERKEVDEEVVQLQSALEAALQHATELQQMTTSQEKALDAFHTAQIAAEEVDDEHQTQIECLQQELDATQDALRMREAQLEVLEKDMEARVAAEQERQKALQLEVDALCEKLTENNRTRLENSNELVEAVTRLQQEKRDAVEDLMHQLEASWEADEESRKHIRILRGENEALAARAEHSTNELHTLEHLRYQESRDRQERLNELVALHQHQLQALRGERDDAIRKLHAQEIARSDLDFTVAELRSKLSRYQTDAERDGPLITHEQTQLDELRARLHVLTRELDSDHQLLREKDAQVHDLNRRVVEYELLAVEQDQRRHETAAAIRERDAALREREAVLERERAQRNERASKHHQELEQLHRRVASLEEEQNAVVRSSMVVPPTPNQQHAASRRRGSPAALNPVSLDALKSQNLSSGWYPAKGAHDTPSVVSSRRAADDVHDGAHLVVLIRSLEDLQHNGKPLKAQEVFVKLKTIKEKHRSSVKPLRNLSSDIGERYAFQLADPTQDVVHLSVFARTPGSLFDNELHVGDVDLSMATLSRGVDRIRRVVIVQDARTKKARVAGYAQVVLRSDDFGAPSPPSTKEVAAEAQKYAAAQQRFAIDFPEKLHAIDVYMAGEAAAIEEADRRHR